jgi:hypothetical protein
LKYRVEGLGLEVYGSELRVKSFGVQSLKPVSALHVTLKYLAKIPFDRASIWQKYHLTELPFGQNTI